MGIGSVEASKSFSIEFPPTDLQWHISISTDFGQYAELSEQFDCWGCMMGCPWRRVQSFCCI
jgi:hypothetical protein